ncbi:MAG TPA: hydantoinase B/oxoprolinase family protein [Longimicrobiales bacterium]|nr:hydantoinase B/oxoprolinase family protein [Longimicrobiales bacterium]
MQRSYATFDPIRLEVYRHLFTALTEEMGAALRGAAYSPNIKERRDYSCALFDAEMRVIAMGDHMPVHLGAMPMSVAAAIDEFGALAPGDAVMLNDPFRGGTHLPDITMVMGVGVGAYRVRERESSAAVSVPNASTRETGTHPHPHPHPLGYLAVRAHHADVGGISAGSMPLAREIFQEGLRIPPVRILQAGKRNDDVWRLLLANVRTPEERAGDLAAQLGCLAVGERRLHELLARSGEEEVRAAMAAIVEYAERVLLSAVARMPAGVYRAQDVLEDDGFGNGPLAICAQVTITSDGIHIDFAGSAAQTTGGVNAVASITASAAHYVVRCIAEAILGESLPAGGGAMRCLHITMPERSIVNAAPPASVAAGNVETSQRITDVLFAAFAHALPDLVPADSQGTMNNLTLGGIDPRSGQPFAYYETMGGGMGASPSANGLSGVHVHMSNSLNTPIEALEHAYPVRVVHYNLRPGTGGRGRQRGGDGIRRDIRLLADADVSLLSERRRIAPHGLQGGGDGACGENLLINEDGETTLPSKTTFRARSGDTLSLRSPGGGGCGQP